MIHQSSERLGVTSRVALVAVSVVVVGGAAKIGAVVCIPIVASLLLCLMLWPTYRWMRGALPRWVAAGICSVATALALIGAGLWGWYAADSAASQFRSSETKYLEKYDAARKWLSDLGLPAETIPSIPTEEGWEQTAGSGSGWATGKVDQNQLEEIRSIMVGGLRSVLGMVTALLLTIFLLFLALYEGERWSGWALEQCTRQQYLDLSKLFDRWIQQGRKYFFAKTMSGLVSGGATALWLWFMGVPLPVVWGVLTLLLNYVPNFGALISGLPPALLAIMELGWSSGLVVAGGLVIIEVLVGNLLDPVLGGNMLILSTYSVLASLLFWGWLWGVAGAVMAPLLTAMIMTGVAAWVEASKRHAEGGIVSTPL
jgi:AI-2 transport protein TqsA